MPVNAGCRRLRLVNPHTRETFDGPFRNGPEPIASALEDLSMFLRDFHSGEHIPIDVGVLDFLATLLEAIGETEAIILSGYRSPETNALLARTHFGVADNSQHMYGRALDVTFHAKVPEAMRLARSLQQGGVGWYPQSDFIHIDTGPIRNWNYDQSGLDSLIAGNRSIAPGSSTKLASAHFSSPHLEASGRPLPSFAHSGRRLPVLEQSGRLSGRRAHYD